jgi:leader peptidase (prepilin peptidase) / N-methyltransferase
MNEVAVYALTALWALGGAVVGSLLNLVADRLPSDQSVTQPPSCCSGCQRVLHPMEMIPVFSYLALRGRCRTCGHPIPVRVLLVEIAAAAICGWVFFTYGPTLATLGISAYLLVLLVITVIDIEHHIIPTIISYPAILLALAVIPLRSDIDWKALLLGGGLAAGILIAISAVGALIFRKTAMARGDITLSLLIGLVTGWPNVIVALYVAIISGGLVAVLLILTRRTSFRRYIPYGPFLALGGAVGLLHGQAILTWYTSGMLQP